jgi:hypothetical protein
LTNTKSMIRVSIILLLFLCLFTAGCAKNEEPQDAQLQALKQNQEQEKESEKLKDIEADLEAVFEVLGGPSVKTDKSSKHDQQTTGEQEKTDRQQGDGQKTGEDQSGKDQGEQKQNNEKQGEQQQTSKDQQKPQVPDKWSKAEELIRKLHYKWNDFSPDLSKKGADIKLIDNFDNALNQLTTTISSRDTQKVLTSANTLYSKLPDLYSLYRTKLSPEAKRMVYYTRNIILEAAKDNWEQVATDNEAIEKSWSLFRNTLENEQKKPGDKLNFSIYELKKVSAEKNKQLTDIKGKIVLDNIRDLQKSIEEKK